VTSLIDAVHAGEDPAIRRLYEQLAPAVLRYLRAWEFDSAVDLSEEIWAHVARTLHTFTGDDEALVPWVFDFVRRHLIDHQRRAARFARPVEHRTDFPQGDHDTPAYRARYAAAVIVRSLPAAQAEAVLLRSAAGLSVGQIAKVINRTEASVLLLQHRAVDTLARIVEQDGKDAQQYA
jgi:RNA polymerase sigma-70 factor (ECF subfamily)